jgi:hypothetical protein
MSTGFFKKFTARFFKKGEGNFSCKKIGPIIHETLKSLFKVKIISRWTGRG